MLVSYNWLKDYVDIEESAQELAEIITRAGVEVGGIEPTNKGVSGVVVAKVLECVDHPDSDHLHVCQVTTDGNNRIQVVCGAPNVAAGQTVMFAQVGAVLPGDMVIGKRSMRGQESNGMICSMQEIGIPEDLVAPADKDGIRVLPEDAPLGADVMEYLGLNDYVLDLDLTPNRSDCLSVYNVAKEVGALLKKPVKSIEITTLDGDAINSKMTVTNKAPELCHRFTGTMIEGAKIGRSPIWMEHRLQCAGMRPISNLVDVTNYVMMELGQPLHAYDYTNLAGHEIIVRTAEKDEYITTLDGQDRALTEEMLLICDGARAIGVAGVMGGENTEVEDTTQDVFIEAAYFQPTNVRRTAVALGLRTEASLRFEKNVDIDTTAFAGWRAANLMVETAGATLVAGQIDDYPTPHAPVEVSLKYQKANDVLGADIPFADMRGYLVDLGFEIIEEDAEGLRVKVPSHRPDVSIQEDLIEEIARLYGYDNIPVTLPFGATNPGVLTVAQRMVDKMKSTLVGLGLNEIVTYSFISKKHCDLLRYKADDPRRQQIAVSNPLSEDMSVMRTSLLPCMLDTISANVHHQQQNLALFEASSVFFSDHALDMEHLADERQHLVMALTGQTRRDWQGNQKAYDFYYLKGLIETLLSNLHITDWHVEAVKDDATWHPGRTAALYIGDTYAGIFGEIHPLVCKNYDLKAPVYAAELAVDALIKDGEAVPVFAELPKYPAVPRDLAVVVDKDVPMDAIKKAILATEPAHLKKIDVFDVYEGIQLGLGKKSIAFSLVFQSDEQTLTDDLVQAELDKIVKAIEDQCQGQLRG
ncbi:MAG: phenylalanine--tRNA ligase subunit beta [Peptococcaceae bacterium]|nr:phenylalanine--tRNA ligase subunit beta [Peptococcaceae bacterium]